MCDLLILIWGWLSEPWWIGLWTSISSIALISTLLLVYFYTKATKEMAIATQKMADVNKEDVILKKRPIILLGCVEKDFLFRTTFMNLSMVHAKIRVKATIVINGKRLKLTDDSLYDGKRIWQL